MATRITGTITFSGYLSPVSPFPGIQRIVVVLTNPNSTPATIELGADSFGARLYTTEGLTGTPLWDDRPPSYIGIIPPTYAFDVQGLSSLPFETTAFLNDAELKRVVPAGTYYVALTWRTSVAGAVLQVRVGTVTVTSSQ
jgi:hypothetical protein